MTDNELFGNSEQLDCSDCLNHGGDWDCDHVHCRKGTDTISRQAALDAIKKLEKPAPTAQHLSAIFDCEDIIVALPSAQPGWIPCSERLPEDEEEVIVSIHDDSGDNALDYSSSGWYAPAGDFWVVENETNSRVIAWMPLPTPYREGGQDENN